jgi:hypothetical protein
MEKVHCMLQTHTLRLCNIHYLSTATMVEQTRLDVTLYAHCLSCPRITRPVSANAYVIRAVVIGNGRTGIILRKTEYQIQIILKSGVPGEHSIAPPRPMWKFFQTKHTHNNILQFPITTQTQNSYSQSCIFD